MMDGQELFVILKPVQEIATKEATVIMELAYAKTDGLELIAIKLFV